jgi:hypothetical protein
MALEPIILDDLTWSDTVTRIRSRIPALSDGKWTLHAPVDPGVTLLELFAWLLEQRVFWLDQVPDSLIRAALDLLGVDPPKPTQSAATLLALSDPLSKLGSFVSLQPLTEMRLQNQVPPIIFSISKGVTLLPITSIAVYVAERDRTTDLEQGRVIRFLPADGSAAEFKIVLWLSKTLPRTVPEEPLSLFFDLRTSDNISPEWSPEAVADVPPPAEISWEYSSIENGTVAPFKKIDDGTGGLRRSGMVRLWFPSNSTTGQSDWEPLGPSNPNTDLIPYALWIKVKAATFSAPPRLARLTPNVAIACHLRLTQTHRLKQIWLPLPGNVIELAELPKEIPEKDHPPLEQSVVLHLKERDNQWRQWKAVADLAFYGPSDRVFLVDRQEGLLRFGDGSTGRLPVLSKTDPLNPKETNVKVRYFVGGGEAGILGDNRDWEMASNATLSWINLVPTEGGAEPESIDSARQRAAAFLRRHERAITRPDYEELARTTPGIAIKRAHAAIGYHPDHPCTVVPGAVTVFIVPDVPRETVDEQWVENAFVAAPQPDPGALAAVRARLDKARLITSEIFVCGPCYRPVALSLTVEADQNIRQDLSQQIRQSLQDFLDPLLGGDDRQGWPFGEPLRPSVILREAQRVVPDGAQVTKVSICLMDDDIPAKDCSEVSIGPHELLVLKEITIQLNLKTVGFGGLR